ncbi:MAG: hypothetical protein ACK44A_05655 [Roseateles sp.]
MHNTSRWIAFSLPLAVALLGAASAVQAFTDSNAELKEVAADRRAQTLAAAQVRPPLRAVRVPPSPKQLDGFAPVLPAQGRAPQTTLAQAEARATPR